MVDLSDAVSAARALLGWQLVHNSPEGIAAGYIVETEAYAQDDPASHAYKGLRTANAAMFEPAGTIYVYFTYGMHYCVNIVTGPKGKGEAVLIRALEPTRGLGLMKHRRRQTDPQALCSGPAKLVQAMGITKSHSGLMINKSPITLQPGFPPEQIIASKRIGISQAKDHLWRFHVKDNSFISRAG